MYYLKSKSRNTSYEKMQFIHFFMFGVFKRRVQKKKFNVFCTNLLRCLFYSDIDFTNKSTTHYLTRITTLTFH